jgi:response regulator of citrate/malate metabolism
VVVTSWLEKPDIKNAYRFGVHSYVVKPVEFEKFVHAMAHVRVYWVLLNEPPR